MVHNVLSKPWRGKIKRETVMGWVWAWLEALWAFLLPRDWHMNAETHPSLCFLGCTLKQPSCSSALPCDTGLPSWGKETSLRTCTSCESGFPAAGSSLEHFSVCPVSTFTKCLHSYYNGKPSRTLGAPSPYLPKPKWRHWLTWSAQGCREKPSPLRQK